MKPFNIMLHFKKFITQTINEKFKRSLKVCKAKMDRTEIKMEKMKIYKMDILHIQGPK